MNRESMKRFDRVSGSRCKLFLWAVLFGVCVLLLGSCTWLQRQNTSVPIVAAADGMQAAYVLQAVTVKSNNSEQRFLALVEVRQGDFQLAGLTELGQRIFTVTSAGGAVEVSKSEWLPTHISVKQLLALFQFVYWPESSLKKAYAGELRIELRNGQRSLYNKQALVAIAQFSGEKSQWEDKVELRHVPADIEIVVDPLEVKYL